MKEAMVSAAQAAGVGNVPKGVARLIKDLTEPKMNWRELLNQQIQSVIKSNYTFMRPSRKAWHTGAVLPGMDFDQTIDIAIALDMSGSIANAEAQDFLSEVKGICDQYDDYKIKVWCFDTEVYNEQDFTPDSGVTIEDYELHGGGGTDFDANWVYMKENDIQPKKLIVFTDGYSWNWGDENYCDTIWVIHSDTSIEAPHGITCHYDDKREMAA
jgi:predicted metal-dependent peptidase